MTVVVPTLSSRGWVRAPAEKADYLLSHFFEADRLQTYLYGDNVSSLQFLVEQHGHDPLTFCSALQQTLQNYLGRYFDSAQVEVTSDDNPAYNTTPNPTSAVTVRIWASVVQEGKEYSIVKLIETANSKLVRVLDLINNGSA
jgi:hypothetical protein